MIEQNNADLQLQKKMNREGIFFLLLRYLWHQTMAPTDTRWVVCAKPDEFFPFNHFMGMRSLSINPK